ncbi:hypothetical protein [Xenococcus sp. PCC 7305]|uniref:hypothetical protein n=1 Tax=Xenococcus sp. PCC 7305 TaxID=102125 RepID=UPI00030C012F|nr:hypothetical protein [Xenococcus sp. PCC 7305]
MGISSRLLTEQVCLFRSPTDSGDRYKLHDHPLFFAPKLVFLLQIGDRCNAARN